MDKKDKTELPEPDKQTRRGMGAYRENPFWQPQEVRVGSKFIRVAGGTHVSDDGEPVSHSGIHLIEEVDKDEFVKIYTRNMKVFFDLRPSAQKVLQAVLSAVQSSPNSDAIYLHWFSVEEFSHANNLTISRASFHNAMRELISKGFIAESVEPHKFWINPHLFFNGDRMAFIREYRIKPIKAKSPDDVKPDV